MRSLPCGKPISNLGFGCSSIWAKRGFAESRAAALLEVASAHGINHFDTSPSYADGEVRLGAFLQRKDLTQLVVSTKVGTEHGNLYRSFDPTMMRRSLAESLKRLGVTSVDILYLHGPSLSDLNPSVADFFAREKGEGRIRYAGVNSFNPTVVEACVTLPWVDAVMLQYSISDTRFDPLIELLDDAGKIVIAGTIMAQGIFNLKTFLPRDAKSLWYLLRAVKNDPLFPFKGRRLAQRLAAAGLPPHEAAVRFAVSNPRLTSCLFSTSSPDHLAANARAGALRLSDPERWALAGLPERSKK